MKYSKEYIENLLGKFIKGLTTEKEELELAEYFETAEDVPAEWLAYREMFCSFKTSDYDFREGELDAMLAQDVVMEQNAELSAERSVRSRPARLWRWVSVAACACVLAAVAIWSWTASIDNGPVAETMLAEGRQKVVSDDEPEVNVSITQDSDLRKMSAKKNEGNAHREPMAEQCFAASRNAVREVDAIKKVDDILASVTFPDEQVESYEIRKVGDANIVTKHYDDGTSNTFIVSSNDDGSGSRLIALN